MSDVLNKMKSRRSIRKFKPDMVPQEILDQIIEAGPQLSFRLQRKSFVTKFLK